MPDLKTQFETAAAEVQKLPKRPDDKTLLTLYASTSRPPSGT